jgi:hypothetical protein
MRKKNTFLFSGLTLIWLLITILPSCAPQAVKAPQVSTEYTKEKGYLFEIGQVKAGNFETPPYLPEKIRFQLTQDLEGKGLLAPPSSTGKRLIVNITVSARYAFYNPTRSCMSCYETLTSAVEVVNPSIPQTVAKTVIQSYNAWGSTVSDFTETSNAEEIAKFLESIVR